MKKWAAYGYIFFTIINLLLAFIVAPRMEWRYEAALFPADVVCCFFILIYFRRFE